MNILLYVVSIYDFINRTTIEKQEGNGKVRLVKVDTFVDSYTVKASSKSEAMDRAWNKYAKGLDLDKYQNLTGKAATDCPAYGYRIKAEIRRGIRAAGYVTQEERDARKAEKQAKRNEKRRAAKAETGTMTVKVNGKDVTVAVPDGSGTKATKATSTKATKATGTKATKATGTKATKATGTKATEN